MNFHHHEPFAGNLDAGFADPLGDRSALMEEVGRLRREVHRLEDELGHVARERDHYKQMAEKKRWLRR